MSTPTTIPITNSVHTCKPLPLLKIPSNDPTFMLPYRCCGDNPDTPLPIEYPLAFLPTLFFNKTSNCPLAAAISPA